VILEDYGFRFLSEHLNRLNTLAIRSILQLPEYETEECNGKCCIKDCKSSIEYLLEWKNGETILQRSVCGHAHHLLAAASPSEPEINYLERLVDAKEDSIEYPEYLEVIKDQLHTLYSKK